VYKIVPSQAWPVKAMGGSSSVEEKKTREEEKTSKDKKTSEEEKTSQEKMMELLSAYEGEIASLDAFVGRWKQPVETGDESSSATESEIARHDAFMGRRKQPWETTSGKEMEELSSDEEQTASDEEIGSDYAFYDSDDSSVLPTLDAFVGRWK